ncbi:olfactory receptor 10H1 [Alligator mississippiensis]|uniref:olfactory receptor 10H1 n=1 Tax=Alligator mississippiensis TaxID=8496 RepID=UPI00287814B0|nr:olfactory receptor 10H1 [Alligator mississippiensis]
MQWENQTTVTEFILIGFSNFPELQVRLFVVLLLVYLVTLAGNTMIMMVIQVDWSLHTPMYFFLGALSSSEICYTFTIIPKMLFDLVGGNRTISFLGCAVQMYFSFLFGFTHSFLLTVMGYDRYVAICNPLRYNVFMNTRICVQMVAASWAGGCLIGLVVTVTVFHLPFCGPNKISHFFCHMPPLVELTCSDSNTLGTLVGTFCMAALLGCFLFILLSYGFILGTILCIPSAAGQHKAFSTCASHLTVVIVHYGCASIIYLKHKSPRSSDAGTLIDLTYTVITPFLSPIIFSLRNKKLKNAFRKSIGRSMFSQGVCVLQMEQGG